VVLGLGINGLGVVRALGRAGIPVVGTWSGRDEAGRLSRYSRPVRLTAHRSAQALDDLLHALGGKGDRPVLFATCDADAAWMNEQQDVLREHFRFHAVGRELFSRLESKRGIVELLREQGIEAPRTEHFDSLREFDERAPALPMPLLVKPIDTYRRMLPAGAKNELFSNHDSLIAFVRLHPAHLPDMVFQEVIPSGDGHIHFCTILMDASGHPSLRYTGRKLRQYRPDYGVTCFGLSEWNEEVASIATRFLQGVGYRGLCTLEFARDRRTGRYLLLEANPRSYYPNALATDSGLNFPLAEYRLLMGEALPASPRQEDGLHWIDFPRDLGSFYRKLRAGQVTTAAWVRSLSKARSFASFALDDPGPWLDESFSLLARVLKLPFR
jgi:predicted ATP-grasp superfamily ATP-dependent carboligase